jgi:class 3 adenylate cyclase
MLFCHLVGATALAARLDPEDLREMILGFQRVCADVIARHGGHLAQFLGDGVLAHFGHPQAHEDDPDRAVCAGLELVAVAGRLMSPGGPALQTRVGIATGLVVVGNAAGGAGARRGRRDAKPRRPAADPRRAGRGGH